MPTGYTHDVQTGKVTNFNDFAMSCARAFGALIMMRDDPADAPIPEFKPTDFYERSIETASAGLLQLEAMSPDDVNRAMRAEYDEAIAAWKERKERRAAEKLRYEAMLAKVKAWEPPSADHVGLKEFMVKQLAESIDFDCNGSYDEPPKFVALDDWKAKKIAGLRRDIERSRSEHAKEIERTNGRNLWVRQLRESLTGQPTAK